MEKNIAIGRKMQIPTVSKGFGWIDLKLTGILLGILSIMGNTYCITAGSPTAALSWIGIPASILWLFGIYYQHPQFLAPNITLDIFCTFFIFLAPFNTLPEYKELAEDKRYAQMTAAQKLMAFNIYQGIVFLFSSYLC